jgi:hypothetical protein
MTFRCFDDAYFGTAVHGLRVLHFLLLLLFLIESYTRARISSRNLVAARRKCFHLTRRLGIGVAAIHFVRLVNESQGAFLRVLPLLRVSCTCYCCRASL